MPIEGFVIEGGYSNYNEAVIHEQPAEPVRESLVDIYRQIARRSGSILLNEIQPTLIVHGTGKYYRQDRFIVVDFPEAAAE